MNMKQVVVHVFQNFANFNGRARRSEYWYFQLFNWALPIVLFLLGLLSQVGAILVLAWVITFLYGLVCIIPGLALTCRRLHDVGKPGSYMFFWLLPIAGEILMLVWTLQDSDPGENRYGKNPKEEPAPVIPSDWNFEDVFRKGEKKSCPRCGAAVKAGAKFCGNCGAEIPETKEVKSWVCECGKKNPMDSAFCPACGRKKPDGTAKFAYCAKCGKKIPVGKTLCDDCARPVAEEHGGFTPPSDLD